MEHVNLFLEGPGRERRPVKLVASEDVPMEQYLGTALHSKKPRGATFCRRTLVDERGNIAHQIDQAGLRYKFEGSDIPWALIVG